MLARLATRRAKPGGSFHLVASSVHSFLAPLHITDLPGFGWSASQKIMEKMGTTNLGELLEKSKGQLSEVLGKVTGAKLYDYIRGVDTCVLKGEDGDEGRKSVGCEINVRSPFFSHFSPSYSACYLVTSMLFALLPPIKPKPSFRLFLLKFLSVCGRPE